MSAQPARNTLRSPMVQIDVITFEAIEALRKAVREHDHQRDAFDNARSPSRKDEARPRLHKAVHALQVAQKDLLDLLRETA